MLSVPRGVEFAGDPHNPLWARILADCAAAGYRGIAPGPERCLPDAFAVPGAAPSEQDLIGGVVFRRSLDPQARRDVLDDTHRSRAALAAKGVQHLVFD